MKIIINIKNKILKKLIFLWGFLRHKFEDQQVELIKLSFKYLGINATIPYNSIIVNAHHISIGDNFYALDRLRLEAWDNYEGVKFEPKLTIGNNVTMNTDIHIGCINEIRIGNNVLMASRIFIEDCTHGEINKEALLTFPSKRPLVSKGPIIIGNNVWIGEGVCILAGVSIGDNAIIGANSVITKSIPSNAIVVGVPGNVIKILE